MSTSGRSAPAGRPSPGRPAGCIPALAGRTLAAVALAGAAPWLAPPTAGAQAACTALAREDAPAAIPRLAPPLDRPVPGASGPAAVPLRTALDQLAAAAGVRLSYSRELLPLDRPTCPPPARTSLGRALAQVLAGTGVQAVGVGDDQVVLAPTLAGAAEAGAAPTSPRLAVLEQVVVTGSATGAPARRLPYALDVVDGTSFATAAGAGTAGLAESPLAGALDGRVPGLWLWAQPPTALLARYGSLRGASSFGVSTPKLYLDGVEVANPLVVTDLPADRIARVEVIRGPQGAALYGADAISGVINVVTRQGGATGALRTFTARGGLGGAGSDYAGRPAVAQDYALSLRSGAGARTGGLSLSATSLGAYAPGAASRRVTATADVQRVTAGGTLAASLRLADATTDAGSNPLLAPLLAMPAYTTTGRGGAPDGRGRTLPNVLPGRLDRLDSMRTAAGILAGGALPGQRLRQLTAGVTLTRVADARWTHALTAGVDAYGLSGVATNFAAIPTPLDSGQRAARGSAARTTLRGSSTATFTVRPGLRATVLALADYGLLRDATADGGLLARDPRLAGVGGPGSVRPGGFGDPRRDGRRKGSPLAASAASTAAYLGTAGVVGQATFALRDALFLTAGLRGERNDGFTRASRFAALPSFGASFVRPLGTGATVKLRTAYGSGIRPARTATRAASWRGTNALSADLAPERQRGVEAGVDLHVDGLGRAPGAPAFGLHVTVFDQRASDLLQQVLVAQPDSASGWTPPSTADDSARRTARYFDYAVENVGVISNRGFELAGDVRTGPLTLAATYSLVDSRVRQTAAAYGGDLRAGDRMLEVPRHTLGMSAAYQQAGWSASIGAARAVNWVNYDRLALAVDASSRAVAPSAITGAALRNYWRQYAGVTRLEAHVARDVRRGLAVVLTGSNLLDRQAGEPDNATLVPGRTVTLGVRARF